MRAAVIEELARPLVVQDVPEPRCPADGAIVRDGQRHLPYGLGFVVEQLLVGRPSGQCSLRFGARICRCCRGSRL
jgi:hypothetical protein